MIPEIVMRKYRSDLDYLKTNRRKIQEIIDNDDELRNDVDTMIRLSNLDAKIQHLETLLLIASQM